MGHMAKCYVLKELRVGPVILALLNDVKYSLRFSCSYFAPENFTKNVLETFSFEKYFVIGWKRGVYKKFQNQDFTIEPLLASCAQI